MGSKLDLNPSLPMFLPMGCFAGFCSCFRNCMVTRPWPGLFVIDKNKPYLGPSLHEDTGQCRNLRLRTARLPWGRGLCCVLRAWVGRGTHGPRPLSSGGTSNDRPPPHSTNRPPERPAGPDRGGARERLCGSLPPPTPGPPREWPVLQYPAQRPPGFTLD